MCPSKVLRFQAFSRLGIFSTNLTPIFHTKAILHQSVLYQYLYTNLIHQNDFKQFFRKRFVPKFPTSSWKEPNIFITIIFFFIKNAIGPYFLLMLNRTTLLWREIFFRKPFKIFSKKKNWLPTVDRNIFKTFYA